MSVSTHEREAAKAVYKDIVDHISARLDDFGTRSLEIGAWGETERTITSSTIDIFLYQIDHVRVDCLVEVCKKHPCYLDCTIISGERGESHLTLQFLWVDPDDYKRDSQPRYPQRQVSSKKPSCTELFVWILLGLGSGGLLYGKKALFGY
jgi:hypothetical protein